MNKVYTFFHSPVSTKFLLLKVLFLLPFCQICVTFLPLTRLIKVFNLAPQLNTIQQCYTRESSEYIGLIYQAVSTIRRNVPFMSHSKCLAQALTARYFLKKGGFPCILLVGANIGEKGKMEAHAWITHGSLTLNFGSDSNHFTEITKFY